MSDEDLVNGQSNVSGEGSGLLKTSELESTARRAAFEIAYALNESHCTGAPIHGLTRALLGDASDFGDIADAFVDIVAPIITDAMEPASPVEAEVVRLEFEVVQAAIEWREAALACEKHLAQHFDFTKGYSVMNGDLSRAIAATGTDPFIDKEQSLGKAVVVAVDALIEARKQVETKALYGEKKI